MGLPWWLRGKESACQAEDTGLIPGLRRSPGGGHGNPTPAFLPGKSHGQRSLRATVHGVTKESVTEQQYMYVFILRNRFTWSWRLVKSKIWPGMWNAGDFERSCSSSSKASAGRIPLSLGEVSHCSIQAFNCLDEAHSRYGGQSALLKVHQFKC